MESGLFKTQSVSLPVEKIDSISFGQNFISKIFNVGNIVIVSREVVTTSPLVGKDLAESIISKIKK